MISIDTHRSVCSPLRLALAATICLLAIPYLVDVGYMEDQTPTHSAQETLSDKDDIGGGDVFVVFGSAQDHAIAAEPAATPARPGALRPDNLKDRTVTPVEYLDLASLISRPPPLV